MSILTNIFSFIFRVISGAPEDENQYQYMAGVEKAGAVYRCQTDPPHHCEQIPFDTSGKKTFQIFFFIKN